MASDGGSTRHLWPAGNEYLIERHLPLRDPISRERTVGEVLDLLVGVAAQRSGHGPDRTQTG